MQKDLDVKELFNKLPEDLKKLIPKPEFSQKSFEDISCSSIQPLINYVKTNTLLSLFDPPKLQSEQTLQLKKFKTKPVILVFCQPSEELSIDKSNQIYPYTPVAYCSWLQSAGAISVPLPYNMNEGSIQFLLQRCNGLLIPGGGSNLYKSYEKKEGFGPVMIGFQKIWRMINKIWQRGVYFPVWGTCLGLQIVLMAITNDVKILSNLNSRGHQLEIYSNYSNSQITSNMSTQLRIQLQNRKLMNFQHAHGISVQKFISNQKLCDKLKITGISKDKDGKWFCSLIEGKQNPIFLSQFHPEKQAFQWTLKGDILHQKYAVLLSQYFGEQFVLQCMNCSPSKTFTSDKQLKFYMTQEYKQIHTPLKMYKVYAIDYKFRYICKQSRKQMKSQRCVSTSTRSIGSSNKVIQQRSKKDPKKTKVLS